MMHTLSPWEIGNKNKNRSNLNRHSFDKSTHNNGKISSNRSKYTDENHVNKDNCSDSETDNKVLNDNVDSVVFEHIVPRTVKQMWVRASTLPETEYDIQKDHNHHQKRLRSKHSKSHAKDRALSQEYGDVFISHDMAVETLQEEQRKKNTTKQDVSSVSESPELPVARNKWGINLRHVIATEKGNKSKDDGSFPFGFPKLRRLKSSENIVSPESISEEYTSKSSDNFRKPRSRSIDFLEYNENDSERCNEPMSPNEFQKMVQLRRSSFEYQSIFPIKPQEFDQYNHVRSGSPTKRELSPTNEKSSLFYQAPNTFSSENTLTTKSNKFMSPRFKNAPMTLEDLLKQDELSLTVDVVEKQNIDISKNTKNQTARTGKLTKTNIDKHSPKFKGNITNTRTAKVGNGWKPVVLKSNIKRHGKNAKTNNLQGQSVNNVKTDNIPSRSVNNAKTDNLPSRSANNAKVNGFLKSESSIENGWKPTQQLSTKDVEADVKSTEVDSNDGLEQVDKVALLQSFTKNNNIINNNQIIESKISESKEDTGYTIENVEDSPVQMRDKEVSKSFNNTFETPDQNIGLPPHQKAKIVRKIFASASPVTKSSNVTPEYVFHLDKKENTSVENVEARTDIKYNKLGQVILNDIYLMKGPESIGKNDNVDSVIDNGSNSPSVETDGLFNEPESKHNFHNGTYDQVNSNSKHVSIKNKSEKSILDETAESIRISPDSEHVNKQPLSDPVIQNSAQPMGNKNLELCMPPQTSITQIPLHKQNRRVGKLIIMSGEQRDEQLKNCANKSFNKGLSSNIMRKKDVPNIGISLTFFSNELELADDPNEPPPVVPIIVFNDDVVGLNSIMRHVNKKKKVRRILFLFVTYIYTNNSAKSINWIKKLNKKSL